MIWRWLFEELGCLGIVIMNIVAVFVSAILGPVSPVLRVIIYLIVMFITALIIRSVKRNREERRYEEEQELHMERGSFYKTEEDNAPEPKTVETYSPEEFQKLPAWKRVELMKEKEKQAE